MSVAKKKWSNNNNGFSNGHVQKLSLPSVQYHHIFKESIEHPTRFWDRLGDLVTWYKPYSKVLEDSKKPYSKWYIGGEINACYNAIDRHVESGNGRKTAIIYDSPTLGIVRRISYAELLEKVSKLAGLLSRFGVKKGDVVLIYMPLIPETIMAMLACSRIGAIHSVVFGGFAASELKSRIQHAEPKVVIAASCGLEPNRIVDYMAELNKAIAMSSHKPSKCVIFQRRQVQVAKLHPERDVDWEDAIQNVTPAPCCPVEANDPLYIIYTSGTTGDPKAIQRPIGGHLVSLVFTIKYLYGMNPNDVWWATSDFGWQVGHSYMCYGPLCYGITTIVYEGKPTTTPNPSSYFRIINDYRVNGFFTVPTAMRVLRHADPDAKYSSKYDISSLRQIWMAGEALDEATKLWTEQIFGVPVMNHWWQTESGSPISASFVRLANHCKDTTLTTGLPVPGFDIKILNDDGTELNRNESGRIAIKLPLPPGNLTTLYKADNLFVNTYFSRYPGFYETMDSGYIDENGLLYVTGREDDVINVAGHRLSTLAIENLVLSHPDICHACVVPVPDKIKNEVPLCLFVPVKDSIVNNNQISQDLVLKVRENLGPVAAFKLAVPVKGLPTTRSGKICRKAIADLAKSKLKTIPGSVLDPSVFIEIEATLKILGFCK